MHLKDSSIFLKLWIFFFFLHVLEQTPEEIESTKTAIGVLEKLWREMGLKITPKAHILFMHTIKQVERFGGITDLVEDFVEKSHQASKHG